MITTTTTTTLTTMTTIAMMIIMTTMVTTATVTIMGCEDHLLKQVRMWVVWQPQLIIKYNLGGQFPPSFSCGRKVAVFSCRIVDQKRPS